MSGVTGIKEGQHLCLWSVGVSSKWNEVGGGRLKQAATVFGGVDRSDGNGVPEGE